MARLKWSLAGVAAGLLLSGVAAAQDTVTLNVIETSLRSDGTVLITLASGATIIVPRSDIAEGGPEFEPGQLPGAAEAEAQWVAACAGRFADAPLELTFCDARQREGFGALEARDMSGAEEAIIRENCGLSYFADFSAWSFCEQRSLASLSILRARVMDTPEQMAIREQCAIENPKDISEREYCERRLLEGLQFRDP